MRCCSFTAANYQLFVASGRIMLPGKRPVSKWHQKYLCRSSDSVAVRDMASNDTTRCVRDRHVQMRPGLTERSRDTQDLKWTRNNSVGSGASIAENSLYQATDAGQNEGRIWACSCKGILERSPNIRAWGEADWHHPIFLRGWHSASHAT